MKRFFLFFLKSLILDIYLIGYKEIGESILFIVYTDNEPSYCGIVDCYAEEDLNVTLDLLDQLNIKKLNFFCWTHPDLDHSLGIKKVLSKFDLRETKIILPENISGSEYEYNDELNETFKFINEGIKPLRGRHKLDVKTASDYKNLLILDYNNPSGLPFRMSIQSVAPNSTIVRSRLQTTRFHKNDYSIGLVLSIGEVNVLLLGDVENTTLNSFEEYYIPEKIEYIKVPHHTSNGSNKLLAFLNKESKTEVACTTIFKSNNIPDRTLINRYKDFAKEFYCTGLLQGAPSNDFGIIKTSFDIVQKKYNVELRGNSYREF